VIGADGNDQPNGADELHCDRLGRVRIRYHWQDSGNATCWVRVAQRSAGGGMGCQFLPRIGQEVLVQFLENDIDRPIIVGALYNGQGEGGIAPTPGGIRGLLKPGAFRRAHDHAPSAQGNLAGGNSPSGTAPRATAPATATAPPSGASAARNSAARATTSCCSTIPTGRGGSSCAAPMLRAS
jgi:hypothetical protein